jgi:preprotein translocase subunit SecA
MNFFKWLFAKPSYDRILDAYTFDRESLWAEIRKAIHFQQQQQSTVWLITHFADQFFEIQNRLGEWKIDYQILSHPITAIEARELSETSPESVFLALAELLTPSEISSGDLMSTRPVSIIAIERHPYIEHDYRLEEFVRQITSPVKFGYYLSLQDPPFQEILSEPLITLLRHFGMREGELVNSIATTRSLDRLLKRQAAQYDPQVRADSAADWLAQQKRTQR